MHKKHHAIVKRGERVFAREIKQLFEQRRADLLNQLKRLELRQKEGWGYRKVMRRGYAVRAHRVRAHWVMMPVKRQNRR